MISWRFTDMPVFVFDPARGMVVDKATGEPMNAGSNGGPPPTPRIIKDIEPYLSPVSGEYVSGKRAKRDDLARHNCIDAAELPSPTGGKIKSRRLQKKYNLPDSVMHEAAE